MANSQGTAKTLSPEDIEWFRQPVDVQVPPDNQKWLDNLLEMNSKELYDFAVYRYQVPEAAAKVSSRSELVQLVVMANAAGGGGSIIRSRFRYLNELKGLVPPYTQKVRGDRYLYLTRGEGDTMQVYNKQTSEWVPVKQLGSSDPGVGVSTEPQLPKGPYDNASVEGDDTQLPPPPSSDADLVNATIQGTLKVILPALPKMKRQELEEVVRQLGVEDTSEARFPVNADLIDYIRNAAGEGDTTPPANEE